MKYEEPTEDVSQNVAVHEIYSDKESSEDEDIVSPWKMIVLEEIKKPPTLKLVFIVIL